MKSSTASLLRGLFVVVVVLAAVLLRWPGLDKPHFGIDEGVTFTIAQQLAEGEVMYRDAVDHRTPLVPYLKAAILLVAGDWNVFAVRLVLAAMLGLSAVMLWSIGRRLGDEGTGFAAAGVHLLGAFLYLGLPDGPSASTAWFLVFFSTLGFWLFAGALSAPSFRRGLPVGLAFGLSILCKQPALLDFGATWVIIGIAAARELQDRRRWGALFAGQLVGAVLPLAAFAVYFAAKGVWSDFVFYAFTYNTAIYVPAGGPIDYWATIQMPFTAAWANMPVIGVLGVLGGVCILIPALLGLFRPRETTASDTPAIPNFRVLLWITLGWTATGLVATTLSGRTFVHYAAQVLPGLSLAAGWWLHQLYRLLRERRGLLRWAAAVVLLTVAGALSWQTIPRVVAQYRGTQQWGLGNADVPELVDHFTSPAERIFVWGYYPEFYLTSHRLPATRFNYTNFLTGFVPWANMDALVDTSAQIVPGAWDKLQEDFAASPPALIVDIKHERAQGKFPLSDHPLIWQQVVTRYVEVRHEAIYGNIRFYRRLDVATEPLASSNETSESADLQLTLTANNRPGEGHLLKLSGPTGWQHFSIWADGRAVASFPYAPTEPAEVSVFIDHTAFADSRHLQFVGRREDGTLAASPAINLPVARQAADDARGPLPALMLNGVLVQPTKISQSSEATRVAPQQPHAVALSAPARLVYPCEASVRRIDFFHGLHPWLYNESDGYDVVINWLPADGSPPQRIWHTRLSNLTEGRHRSTQRESVALPPRGPGQLEFLFLNGPRSNPQFDEFFFGDASADVQRPRIFLDGRIVAVARDHSEDELSQWMRKADQSWLLHAPGHMDWIFPSPPPFPALQLDYGIDDGAWTPDGGRTDGVTFYVEYFVGDDPEPVPLFTRHLDPLNNPTDRGPQTSIIDIPVSESGVLRIRTTEGPVGNGAWDWAWIMDPVALPAGPPLQWSGAENGRIRASAYQGAGGSRLQEGHPNTWTGHSPSRLEYPKPAGLAFIDFEFGLEDGIPRDESGRLRSDGVIVIVEFLPDGSETPIQVYHRHLDPSIRPEDVGRQHVTRQLPENDTGKLIFQMLPGPNQNAAFDWAYWGTFTGRSHP
ncbi:ArnT family glycosyltransferase [Actomonas aquatica]|uniref:Glycosyltransferase family 39 protein n=1 Tax=Actomonas aquatica TaxID=2866162 RepID=A0ABZ1CA82_9BACT|nr:glycosyltransferase family 39 protein [Opitutus sp. WL0086]WRQ88504.1 glycosyltransferase family 39 protein [Opitutus sp. WL0086]